MNLHRIKINVGAEKPFAVLHSGDHHLCLCDERNDERKQKLAANRANAFTGGHPECLAAQAEEFFAYAADNALPIMYTGDFIDFTSYANFDYARKLFSSADAFMCAGNHEYSRYVGEAWEDEEYKAVSFEEVLASYPNNNIWYDECVINGVRFVAIDNNYYYILPEQFERFRAACSDGMPVVLLVHTPLYSKDIFGQVTDGTDRPAYPPYLFGCPEEFLRNLDDHRYRQQKPDEITLEFVRFCNETPNLKAVFAGHHHKVILSKLDSGIPQIVSGGGANGEAVLCEIE